MKKNITLTFNREAVRKIILAAEILVLVLAVTFLLIYFIAPAIGWMAKLALLLLLTYKTLDTNFKFIAVCFFLVILWKIFLLLAEIWMELIVFIIKKFDEWNIGKWSAWN